MPDPVMVPADLLPGLLRPGAGGIEVARGCRIPVIVVEPEFRRVWARLARGHEMRTPILACLCIDLATSTGWDAAVDALARRFWPDMAPTDRAEFAHCYGHWTLRPPWAVRERSLVQFGVALPGPDEPHEALRRILHHVAGRPL